MTKKGITVVTLIITICFLTLGFLYKETADKAEGVSASIGYIKDGEFVATSSGKIGADREKHESFASGGTMFYILAGISGITCVVSAVISIGKTNEKKKEK